MSRRNSSKKSKTLKRNSSPKGRSRKILSQTTGKVQMTREGSIFVLTPAEEDDVYVKASMSRHALNGDLVRVNVIREADKLKGKRREGQVVEILERNRSPFVGIYHTVGSQAWVLMQSRNMPYDIEVDAEKASEMGAQPGMKVAAVVDSWDRKDICPKGHLTDVLGEPGKNDTEMHAILAEFNLPYKFEPEVENAADKIPDTIGEKEMKGRKDFRPVFTFTIDPADAKDFDDALSFRALENGNFEVGVHIADVSHYVTPGSPVDKEARSRGTSVYLVDRTVPMLPEKLCNKLCSLRPDEDKLCFSAVFEISPRASIKSSWIGRTAIRSNFRLSYEQAQAIIEASEEQMLSTSAPRSEELKKAVLTLNSLAKQLKAKRFKAGAVDFNRPEMKVEVDKEGKPVRVYEKISKEANFLIEEFMLLANRTVAEWVATQGRMNAVASKSANTFVYRIHGEPNELKLESLKTFAKGLGFTIPTDAPTSGRSAAFALNDLLAQAEGRPEKEVLENLALRAMAKACYSTDNIGHYGLAFKFYTHFTSPIRRYPDLMVHRLLARYLSSGSSEDKSYYEQECQYASERELVAADAERTSIKYKLVEYMSERIGQEYEGTVSGLTEWGMYVQTEPEKVEGMIALRNIRSDFFEFDEAHYRLVGRRSHRIYILGDKVRIKVASANLEQRTLDYELVETLQENERPTEPAAVKKPGKASAKRFSKKGSSAKSGGSKTKKRK